MRGLDRRPLLRTQCRTLSRIGQTLEHPPSAATEAAAGFTMAFSVDNRYPPPLRTAYFRSAGVERVAVLAIDEQGKPARMLLDLKSRPLSPFAARDEVIAGSPDLLATVSRIDDGWVSSLLLKDGEERTLATLNEALRDTPVAPWKSFSYTAEDRDLTGWVVLPPEGRAKKPLPAIVEVYGGAVYGPEPPSGAKPSFSLPVVSAQLLAAQGYAVIYPSVPLGAGAETDVMATLANEVVAAVDALAAQGVVDPKRVGVTGQSFGGYSTAALIAKRSDRFRAAVALAGIYDWLYGYGIRSMPELLNVNGGDGAFETEMIETSYIRLGKPFWKDPASYMRNSPIFHVESIDTPLLILQGDLDFGITGLPSAECMYNALVRAGKKPTLVRYWGEGHLAQSAWAIRDQCSRTLTWFKVHLRPDDRGS